MTQVALGLDSGTSGARVVAVDGEGTLVAEATSDYPLLTPRPGWTEQNPSDWVAGALSALREVAGKLEDHDIAYDITALGLAGQMHGMVVLDKHGEVVRPAILWNDQRTGEAVREIEEKVSKEVLIQRTGNPAVTGFQLAKLVWLRREEPENFAKTAHVLLPKDYIGFVLTGEMVAEPSDASGTNCFYIETKAWDEEVLGALDLSAALFPDVVASHEVVGKLKRGVANEVGLPAGLPVIAGAGDNAAAATGLGLSNRNMTRGSVSLGTSGVLFAPLKDPRPDLEGRVHLFCHADGGYNLLGVTLAAAGSLDWYRRTFAPEKTFSELTKLAEGSEPGANGVTFKPYLAGERTPHMNPDLRGSWTGLSLATTQADAVRALLEGVAFSLEDALEAMSPLAQLEDALATGGGAQSDFWLQMVADVLGLPLAKPTQNQGAAYGAALLALQGTGQISSAFAVGERDPSERFEPRETGRYDDALARYRAT